MWSNGGEESIAKYLFRQCSNSNKQTLAPLLSVIRRRFYSEEVRGTFLDKSEVTDPIITVVKNFQKVNPSKDGNRGRRRRG